MFKSFREWQLKESNQLTTTIFQPGARFHPTGCVVPSSGHRYLLPTGCGHSSNRVRPRFQPDSTKFPTGCEVMLRRDLPTNVVRCSLSAQLDNAQVPTLLKGCCSRSDPPRSKGVACHPRTWLERHTRSVTGAPFSRDSRRFRSNRMRCVVTGPVAIAYRSADARFRLRYQSWFGGAQYQLGVNANGCRYGTRKRLK